MRVTKAQLLEAAIDAIDYVAMANYDHRQRAASHWLMRIWNGKTNMSIDEVGNMLEEQLEQTRQENLK